MNGKKYIKGWFYIPTSSHLAASDAALISLRPVLKSNLQKSKLPYYEPIIASW